MAVSSRPRSGRRVLLAVLAACFVVFAASAASGTVMKYADMARLVEISDVVVQGRVVDQKTYFDADYGDVVTDTTIAVDHTFLGPKADTVTFQQWGGEHDGKVAHIPGDAVFEPYEEVVVFLAKGNGADSDKLFLSALSQSKYTILRGEDQTKVTRDLSDLAFLVETPDGERIQPREASIYGYRSFVAELRTLVAGIKGGGR